MIVEVEEIVEAGELDPDEIHTPSIYVDRIVKPPAYEKKIENLVLDEPPIPEHKKKRSQIVREKIVKRAVKYFKDGMFINFGVGMPALVPAFTPKGLDIIYQSDNGILGVGNFPKKG